MALYMVGDDRTRAAIHWLSFDRSKLTERERLVFGLYFDQGLTCRGIEAETKEMGDRIPMKTVARIVTSIKRKALRMCKK